MIGKETEQHTIEDGGWVHHVWDEVGPQLVTGVSIVFVALVSLCAVWMKLKHKVK